MSNPNMSNPNMNNPNMNNQTTPDSMYNAPGVLCMECDGILYTPKGVFRLIQSGSYHRFLNWSHDYLSLPPNAPTPLPADFTLPPLGDGCPICAYLIEYTPANEKGSEIIHPSIAYKYDLLRIRNAINSISFHPIITNREGEEVENPFENKPDMFVGQHLRLVRLLDMVEHFVKHDLRVTGLVIKRGDEEIHRFPYEISFSSLFPQMDLRCRFYWAHTASGNGYRRPWQRPPPGPLRIHESSNTTTTTTPVVEQEPDFAEQEFLTLTLRLKTSPDPDNKT